jgi:hypothetical protein
MLFIFDTEEEMCVKGGGKVLPPLAAGKNLKGHILE